MDITPRNRRCTIEVGDYQFKMGWDGIYDTIWKLFGLIAKCSIHWSMDIGEYLNRSIGLYKRREKEIWSR